MKLSLKVGIIHSLVVIDPTDLSATFVDAQALCLTIFNLSPIYNTFLFTDVNRASVNVRKHIFTSRGDFRYRVAGFHGGMERRERRRCPVMGIRSGSGKEAVRRSAAATWPRECR